MRKERDRIHCARKEKSGKQAVLGTSGEPEKRKEKGEEVFA